MDYILAILGLGAAATSVVAIIQIGGGWVTVEPWVIMLAVSVAVLAKAIIDIKKGGKHGRN